MSRQTNSRSSTRCVYFHILLAVETEDWTLGLQWFNVRLSMRWPGRAFNWDRRCGWLVRKLCACNGLVGRSTCPRMTRLWFWAKPEYLYYKTHRVLWMGFSSSEGTTKTNSKSFSLTHAEMPSTTLDDSHTAHGRLSYRWKVSLVILACCMKAMLHLSVRVFSSRPERILFSL